MSKEQTAKEIHDDIIHIVNVMNCNLMDGGFAYYETKKHSKMYAKFKSMMAKLMLKTEPGE